MFKHIKDLPLDEKVKEINRLRLELHALSPFKSEPVDCVLWIKNEEVVANDYNPNTVAPPEMKLLETSIDNVAWPRDGIYEVVDGFHRHRVGKESKAVNKRIHGYLPLACIKEECQEKGDRIASTIRHNRARGKHKIEAMSDIVLELKKRNWSNERISKNLGMEEDEILRLCQITGLADLFADQEFSRSWNIEDSEPDFTPMTDEITEKEKEENKFRTVNTSDENRIFHTYETWECYKSGFYDTTKEGMTKDECEHGYYELLRNESEFRHALDVVINTWKFSCEHYLTNQAMNRIAWLGQASLCAARGIPAVFRGGYNLLTKEEQDKANSIALEYLNKWLLKNNREQVTTEQAMPDRESTIY